MKKTFNTLQTKLPEGQIYKLQVLNKNTGWQDYYADFPRNTQVALFTTKGDAIKTSMNKFGKNPRVLTRIVTPNNKKLIVWGGMHP